MVADVVPTPGLGLCGSAFFSIAQPTSSRPADASSHHSLDEADGGAFARMLADALDAFDVPASNGVDVRGTRVLGSPVSASIIASPLPVSGPSHGAGSGSGFSRRGPHALCGGSLRLRSGPPTSRLAGSAPLEGGACTATPSKHTSASSPSRIIPASWGAGVRSRPISNWVMGIAASSSYEHGTCAPQQYPEPEPEPPQPAPVPEQPQQASEPEPAPQSPAPEPKQAHCTIMPEPVPQSPAPVHQSHASEPEPEPLPPAPAP